MQQSKSRLLLVSKTRSPVVLLTSTPDSASLATTTHPIPAMPTSGYITEQPDSAPDWFFWIAQPDSAPDWFF
jgi:hypothetical protein